MRIRLGKHAGERNVLKSCILEDVFIPCVHWIKSLGKSGILNWKPFPLRIMKILLICFSPNVANRKSNVFLIFPLFEYFSESSYIFILKYPSSVPWCVSYLLMFQLLDLSICCDLWVGNFMSFRSFSFKKYSSHLFSLFPFSGIINSQMLNLLGWTTSFILPLIL